MEGSVTDLTSSDEEDDAPRWVFSVAFAWRSLNGRAAPYAAAGGGRGSVRWYADCLLDMIHFYASRDRRCRFLVHTHGAIPDVAWLQSAALRTFRDARKGSVHDSKGVTFHVCDAARPAMWPQAMRVAPLVDHNPHDIVILADVHDDLSSQRKSIRKLLTSLVVEYRTLALTFWKADGELGTSFRRDPAILPPPLSAPQASRAMVELDHHYSVDAGLAISLPGFRRGVWGLCGRTPYARYLEDVGSTVEYDEFNGTDEALLRYFLLTRDMRVTTFVRTVSAAWSHALCTTRRCATDPRSGDFGGESSGQGRERFLSARRRRRRRELDVAHAAHMDAARRPGLPEEASSVRLSLKR
jgi:hypothetical protein